MTDNTCTSASQVFAYGLNSPLCAMLSAVSSQILCEKACLSSNIVLQPKPKPRGAWGVGVNHRGEHQG